jgi:hypothetical protein
VSSISQVGLAFREKKPGRRISLSAIECEENTTCV